MGLLTTNSLVWAPSAANGGSVTPNASAWVNSAWTQVIASTAGAIQIEQLAVIPGTTSVEFEIDVGSGTIGNEVVIGTVRGYLADTTGLDGTIIFGLPIDNIAASKRVAVRLRKAGTNTTVWKVALGYYNATDSTDLTVNAQLALPSAAAGLSLTPPGSAWGNSTWIVLTTGLGNAIWFSGFDLVNGAANVGFEIDVGIGGAGAEVVATTLRGSVGALATHCLVYAVLPHPLRIATSTRIALRIRISSTAVGVWTVGTSYYVQEAAGGVVSLKRNSSLSGLGASGPFFHDPLSARYYEERVAA